MFPFPAIFYLDDEQELCDIIDEYCAISNIHSSTFTDPEIALAACKHSPPQLFFIDYRLADTTGDEVALRVPDGVLKILVTGDLTTPDLKNFDSVLKKPFYYKQFVEFITQYTSQ